MSSIKLGSASLKGAYLGNTEVAAIYKGTTKLYPEQEIGSRTELDDITVHYNTGRNLYANGGNSCYWTYTLREYYDGVLIRESYNNRFSYVSDLQREFTNTSGTVKFNRSTYGKTIVSSGTYNVTLTANGVTVQGSFSFEGNTIELNENVRELRIEYRDELEFDASGHDIYFYPLLSTYSKKTYTSGYDDISAITYGNVSIRYKMSTMSSWVTIRTNTIADGNTRYKFEMPYNPNKTSRSFILEVYDMQDSSNNDTLTFTQSGAMVRVLEFVDPSINLVSWSRTSVSAKVRSYETDGTVISPVTISTGIFNGTMQQKISSQGQYLSHTENLTVSNITEDSKDPGVYTVTFTIPGGRNNSTSSTIYDGPQYAENQRTIIAYSYRTFTLRLSSGTFSDYVTYYQAPFVPLMNPVMEQDFTGITYSDWVANSNEQWKVGFIQRAISDDCLVVTTGRTNALYSAYNSNVVVECKADYKDIRGLLFHVDTTAVIQSSDTFRDLNGNTYYGKVIDSGAVGPIIPMNYDVKILSPQIIIEDEPDGVIAPIDELEL